VKAALISKMRGLNESGHGTQSLRAKIGYNQAGGERKFIF
jgi:hypothetical protein